VTEVWLTKSKYLIGRQCSLRLWLAKQSPEPASESEDVWEMRECEGAAVEAQVATFYENPIRVAVCPEDDMDDDFPSDPQVLSEKTQAAIKRKQPILQAFLQVENLLAVVDILEPRDDGWFLWEVKASTKVSPLHDYDLAFQVVVARRMGLKIVGAGVWLLNKDYVRGNVLEASKLVMKVDRTAEVESIVATTATEIDSYSKILRQAEAPFATPSNHCKGNRDTSTADRPSDCGHLSKALGHCGASLPENWVRRLPRLSGPKHTRLTELKILSIEQLDADDPSWKWTTTQFRMIKSVQSTKAIVDADELKKSLAKLSWPIAYIDFEFDPGMAVPRFEGTQPYSRIPFQWSMHIQPQDAADLLEVSPFLWLESSDPRKPFLDSLLAAIPPSGIIVAHSKNAEITVLRQLGESLGQDYKSRTDALEPRFFDTIDLLQSGYYHPKQQGSYSIKKVAPALLGRGYEDLAIQDGMSAVVEWKKAIDPQTAPEDRERTRLELLRYCGRDTLLMHDLILAIREISR
jgi:hypothetical protein